MLISVILGTIIIYICIVACRLLDPPGRIIKLSWLWWAFVGLVIAGLTWHNFHDREHYVLIPLNVVLILEYTVSLMYKYVTEHNPDNNVILQVHDRYLAVAKYFMPIMPVTMLAIVWMLCTS